MKWKWPLGVLASLGLMCSQAAPDGAIVVNLAESRWTHEAGDAAGSESVFLREDPRTGGMELLARYPAGHVFAPHWHSVNERIVLLEGRLSVRDGGSERYLEPGGFAFLPTREVQRLTCVSKTRCTFYVNWDGKLDNHKAAD